MYEEIWQIKLKLLLEREGQYEFPEFVKLLRSGRGVTRKLLGKDTLIPESVLFRIEKGNFQTMPGDEVFITLAKYFGVSEELLKKKCQEFYAKKEIIPRGRPKIYPPRVYKPKSMTRLMRFTSVLEDHQKHQKEISKLKNPVASASGDS